MLHMSLEFLSLIRRSHARSIISVSAQRVGRGKELTFGPESVEIEAAAGRTFRFTFADASAHQAGACYSHHRSSLEEVSSFHKVEVRGVKLTILMK